MCLLFCKIKYNATSVSLNNLHEQNKIFLLKKKTNTMLL